MDKEKTWPSWVIFHHWDQCFELYSVALTHWFGDKKGQGQAGLWLTQVYLESGN